MCVRQRFTRYDAKIKFDLSVFHLFSTFFYYLLFGFTGICCVCVCSCVRGTEQLNLLRSEKRYLVAAIVAISYSFSVDGLSATSMHVPISAIEWSNHENISIFFFICLFSAINRIVKCCGRGIFAQLNTVLCFSVGLLLSSIVHEKKKSPFGPSRIATSICSKTLFSRCIT